MNPPAERCDVRAYAIDPMQDPPAALAKPCLDVPFLAQSEALAALRRGLIRPGAVMALLGAPGLGKTIVLQRLLAGRVEPVRVLSTADGAGRALRDLNAMAVAAARMTGRPCSSLLVVEEAHALSAAALRRLLGAQQGYRPDPPVLLLVGRPALGSTLGGPGLQSFRDTIVKFQLTPISDAEAEHHIERLFELAGGSSRSVLTREALGGLIRRAQGNPRALHRELDRALRTREPETGPEGAHHQAPQ